MSNFRKLRRLYHLVSIKQLTLLIQVADKAAPKIVPHIRPIVPALRVVRMRLVMSRHRYLTKIHPREKGRSELPPSENTFATSTPAPIELTSILKTPLRQFRIAIKIAVPTYSEQATWGDYYFASCLAKAIEKQGHIVRIDPVENWYAPNSKLDDVAIVLRGLEAFETCPGQVSIMWLISHANKVEIDEYNCYDHVFVASEAFSNKLKQKIKVPVSSLLQCTDPELFYPAQFHESFEPKYSILFVGNTRGEFRRSVRVVQSAGLPLLIIGSGWGKYVSSSMILNSYLPYKELRSVYQSCTLLLNDHWDDMRENGFISNRVYDAVASGATVLTEAMEGLEEIFGDAIYSYASDSELIKAAHLLIDNQRSPKREIIDKVRMEHTFDKRGTEILKRIGELF